MSRPANRSHAADSPPNSTSLSLAFERALLGLHAPPWTLRAEEADFAPDPDNAYCPRCAGPVGPYEVVDADPCCAACRHETLPWSRAVRLGPWTGPLRQAILEAKYARWRRLAFDLGRQLGLTLRRRLVDAAIDPEHVALIPVPMSFRRRWSRGLDHTLAITRGVQVVTGSVIERPLARRHRPPQASLPEGSRASNVRGCFVPRRLAGSTRRLADHPAIVVIDDVRTTGATLKAVCRALIARERRLGSPLDPSRIWVATLAVVTPTNRRAGGAVSESPAEGHPQDSRVDADSLKF